MQKVTYSTAHSRIWKILFSPPHAFLISSHDSS